MGTVFDVVAVDFSEINKKHFLSLVFNQPCCHGKSTHLHQNARLNSSVVNIYSPKERAPNDEQFKRNGELGIGT